MPDTPRSIAFVVAGLGAGGAERVIALLASSWAERGSDVTVIAFDRPSDPVYHRFDPRVQLVRLGGADVRRGVLGNVARLRLLRRALKRIRPQTAISFLTKINVITLLAGTGLGLPIIVSERNNPQRQQANRFWTLMLDRLYPRAAAIVIQTEASRTCLPASVAASARVIPNPIVPMAARPARPEGRTVCAVGRLEDQKGFDLLLAAFAQADATCPGWQLVIWGEGPRRQDLEAQARMLGIDDRVFLPGTSTTPGGWIESADIFALTSRFEGFPNALGEAMAAGIPPVAFDCPFGPAEMIRPGTEGVLVAADDVAGFAAALSGCMRDADLRDRLGRAARQRAGEFDIAAVLPRWVRLIGERYH